MRSGSAPRRVVTSGGISFCVAAGCFVRPPALTLAACPLSLRMIRPLVIAAIAFLAMATSRAGNEKPGARQAAPIALTNATVHTVTQGTISRGTVLFADGRITAVGANISVPQGYRTINCAGRHVYPGFIAPVSTIGLSEIDAVRATRDFSEVGDFNPNARGETAYNPDSDIIPTIRYNGILLANVSPEGGVVSGMASLMRLDGWTREDIAVNPRAALMVNWPQMDVNAAPWESRSADDQRRDAAKRVDALRELFRQAKAYALLTATGDTAKRDIRLEAMARVFRDTLPVFVRASSRKQLEAALDFRREFGLSMVLVGAADAPYMIERLQKEGVGIVIRRVHALPMRDEDAYDAAYTLPATLAKASIPFAFSDDGGWQQRNLPFHAGTAIAYGLDADAALRSLTLSPAKMLKADADYGSVEVGKSATLFISKGNALDARSNIVTHAFIDGREVDLSSRHTRLTTKYRERYKP
jgi:imidazolonepropionase-like amidohydrolase